jgi:hypothetical protein
MLSYETCRYTDYGSYRAIQDGNPLLNPIISITTYTTGVRDMVSSRGTMAILLCVLLMALFIPPAGADITLVTSSPQVLARGDTLTINGTNATNGTCAVWVIGRNYFDVTSVNPDKKGMLTLVIKPKETMTFSSGQYAVLLQDPGKNGGLEIAPLFWSDGIKIANNGKIIDEIGLKENFKGNIQPVVDTILEAAGHSKTDDVFTATYVTVEDPSVYLNKMTSSDSRLPTQTTGEQIVITGITNAGSEDTLSVAIIDQHSGAVVLSKPVPVVSGTNQNSWSFNLDSPGLAAGNYTVRVGWMKSDTDVLGTAQLSIRDSSIVPPVQIPALPAGVTILDVFFPLVISLAALCIIGIIIVVSLKD